MLRASPRTLALCLLATAPAAIHAAAGDTIADRVLGQAVFTAGEHNLIDAGGLALPFGVAVDRSVTPNRLYVADTSNNRVLAWADVDAARRGAAADLVIGQRDPFSSDCNRGGAVGRDGLCFPGAVAVDGAGNLWIADTGNRRVLELDAPFSTDLLADRIAACDLEDLHCQPTDVAIGPAGELAVVDQSRCRVQLFRQPLATDLAADATLGSLDGGQASCNIQCARGDGLCFPNHLTFDAAGNLWVGDSERLRFYLAPLATDARPDGTLGQVDVSCAPGTIGRDTFCAIAGLAFDSRGTLWVADRNAHRIVGFDAPLTTDDLADAVLGQRGSFATAACNLGGPSAESLCSPIGLAIDGADRLWVADSMNNRALRFPAPRTGQEADRLLGQVAFHFKSINRTDRRGLGFPMGVAVDESATPNRLWVADTGNSRVLGWRDAAGFANGAPADLVIGQPGPFVNGCNNGGPSAASLCGGDVGFAALGLAVDAAGNLWVADTANHRVLGYDDPFATDVVADRVLGQRGSFTGRGCNLPRLSPTSLCSPRDVAVAPDGTLWVADSANNRVLGFAAPLSGDATAAIADRVLGQQGRFRTADCAVGADRLCNPLALTATDEGDLFVADSGNNRVLGFRRPAATDDIAHTVLGQRGSVTGNRCDAAGGPSANSLCLPSGLAVDADGDLWVADTRHNRVVEYRAPWDRRRAVRVLGQRGSFTSAEPNRGGRSAATLDGPTDLAFDEDGNLYVADTVNHRLLVYDRP